MPVLCRIDVINPTTITSRGEQSRKHKYMVKGDRLVPELPLSLAPYLPFKELTSFQPTRETAGFLQPSKPSDFHLWLSVHLKQV